MGFKKAARGGASGRAAALAKLGAVPTPQQTETEVPMMISPAAAADPSREVMHQVEEEMRKLDIAAGIKTAEADKEEKIE